LYFFDSINNAINCEMYSNHDDKIFFNIRLSFYDDNFNVVPNYLVCCDMIIYYNDKNQDIY
jgi:hypothetical protein